MRSLFVALLFFCWAGCLSAEDKQEITWLDHAISTMQASPRMALEECYQYLHQQPERFIVRWRKIKAKGIPEKVEQLVTACTHDVPMQMIRSQPDVEVPNCVNKLKAVMSFSEEARRQERAVVSEVLAACCNQAVEREFKRGEVVHYQVADYRRVCGLK